MAYIYPPGRLISLCILSSSCSKCRNCAFHESPFKSYRLGDRFTETLGQAGARECRNCSNHYCQSCRYRSRRVFRLATGIWAAVGAIRAVGTVELEMVMGAVANL